MHLESAFAHNPVTENEGNLVDEPFAAHLALVEVFFGVGLDVSGQLVAPRELLVASDKVALEGTLVLVPHDVRLRVASLPVLTVAPCKNNQLNSVDFLEINREDGPLEVSHHVT